MTFMWGSRMPKLSQNKKPKIIALLHEEKLSVEEIAAKVGVPPATVSAVKAHMTMGTYAYARGRGKVKELLERYKREYIEKLGARVGDYSEQDTATKFIKPLIEALGWDVLSIEEMREEVYIGSKERFMDCVLYLQGKPYIAFEFKSMGVGTIRNQVDVNELINNSKILGARYAVLTRFYETVIYDVETGEELEDFAPHDYLDKFDNLWEHLSKTFSRVDSQNCL